MYVVKVIRLVDWLVAGTYSTHGKRQEVLFSMKIILLILILYQKSSNKRA